MVDVVVGWTVVVSIMVLAVRGALERMVDVMVWRAVSSLTFEVSVRYLCAGYLMEKDSRR